MQNLSKVKSRNSKNNQEKKTEDVAYIQDEIKITQIYKGYIFLDNGKIIGMQEILPVNFFQMTDTGKDIVYECLVRLFRILPTKFQFKTKSEPIDISRILNNLEEATKGITDPAFLVNKEEYIKYIKWMQAQGTFMRRYFILWDYEGNSEGEYSSNVEEIVHQMNLIKNTIVQILSEGRICCYTPNDVNMATCEFIYKFFNPKSSSTEPFIERIKRLNIDASKYSKSVKANFDVYEEDYVAPRGIKIKQNFLIMDGTYYTFLTLTSGGHPSKTFVGWLNHINDLHYDIDVIVRQKNKARSLKVLSEANKIGGMAAEQEKNNVNKLPEILKKNRERLDLYNMLKQNPDENIYDVMILITIHGKDFKDMDDARDKLVARLNSNSLFTMNSWIISYPCLKMSMPFMWVDEAIFSRNRHNYLSSSLASLFNAISENLFEDRGVVLGINDSSAEIVAMDLFNSTRLTNHNFLIAGSSGSGKTFTELIMAGRMLLNGIKTYFVLPAKGYEYERAIKAWGGSYYRLWEVGLNPMAIYPESKINEKALDFKPTNISYLEQKINFLTAFIQTLNNGKPLERYVTRKLNVLITEVYARFGITSENDSVYRDAEKTELKDMPIMEDLYDAVRATSDERLEDVVEILRMFVDGSLQNFNTQTTIPFNNNCIAFDVDQDAVGKEFLSALTFLAYDCLSNLMKRDTTERKMLFVDEAWVLLRDPLTTEQITETTRLIRGYLGGIIVASQQLTDFDTKEGAVLINNTATKLFLKMGEQDLNALRNIMSRLTDDEFKEIELIQKKHGIIKTSENFIKIWITCTQREEYLYTTDGNVKERMIAEEIKRGGSI